MCNTEKVKRSHAVPYLVMPYCDKTYHQPKCVHIITILYSNYASQDSGVSSLGGVATLITMENYSYFPIVTMYGGMCNDNNIINVCTFM